MMPMVSQTQQPSVLVIDDNEDLAENIAEILGDFGVEVRIASDAPSALQAFLEREWSLVVTDVRMPGMDGIALLSELKRHDPTTPVLVMTGFADGDTVARAHNSGALAVMHKPLDLDDFLGLVEHISEAHSPVLVVEDDVALCGNLTDILCEQQGVLPHPATSVELARRLAERIDFDAALIDLRLPDGDGMLLARELQRRPDGSRRRVIIMTGYPEDLGRAQQAAASDDVVVIAKPFPVPSLLEHLRTTESVARGAE